MKFKNIILASTLTLSMISFSNIQDVSASEISNPSNFADQEFFSNTVETNTRANDVDIIKFNNSSLQINFTNENVNVEFNENGVVTLTNGENSEVLPTTAIDVNGNTVNLVYNEFENGLLVELQNDSETNQGSLSRSKRSFNPIKCALGTAGAWISGGVAGAGTGAAVGDKKGTNGKAVTSVGGAIVGAVGGGMAGFATFCTD